MVMYSVRDYCDMYLMYGRYNGNALQTVRDVCPTANLHDTGRPRNDLTVSQADAILHRVDETPEIGRQGPVLWPPRFPVLTPLDFFLMGPFQGTGVSRRNGNSNGLVARLHAACNSLDPAVFRRVMTAIPRHAHACFDMHGGLFEHLP
ncbi:DUF4817 domain-containing protein [Trichonephila clavipes]|nr:DUF4817 domain-containing protein [Trichonephila clavipes]